MIFIAATLIYDSQSQDNICDGHFGQLIPDPDRCYAYINCVLSTPQYYECPIGNIFVESQGQCLPGNRQTCQVHILDEICRGVFWSARPYPGDETGKIYVGCMMGEGTLFSCFENEIFNTEINECILDQITSSTVSSTQTTSTQVPSTTSSSQEQSTTSTSEFTSSTQDLTTSSTTQESSTTSSSEITSSTQESSTSSTSEVPSTTTSTQEISTISSTSTQEITTSSSQLITTTSILPTAQPLNPCLGHLDGKLNF